MIKKFLYSLLVLFFLFPAITLAHGLGVSLEKKSGDYLVDVDYDNLAVEIYQPTRFNMRLLDSQGLAVIFDQVQFSLSKDNQLLDTKTLTRAKLGPTGTEFLFTENGKYTITVNFQKDNQQIGAANFTINIELPNTPIVEWLISHELPIIGGLIIIGLAILTYVFFTRSKNTQE
jgi:hypothetical protein